MNKTRVILSLIAAVGMVPAVAMADVVATVDVNKTKDIRITERINITKTAQINARVARNVQKAAESQALVNQTNNNNEVCTNCDEKRDIIRDSGNNNSGVLKINQAGGNLNNQGNAISIAVDDAINQPPSATPDPDQGFANSQAHVDQKNNNNNIDTVNIVFREAHIENSINGNSGLAHVNQATGNMANQSNAFSLAVTLTTAGGGIALAEADLGQVNAAHVVLESDSQGRDQKDREIPGLGFSGIKKDVQMISSVNLNTGVVGLNQSSGNMANQANVVSFASAGVK